MLKSICLMLIGLGMFVFVLDLGVQLLDAPVVYNSYSKTKVGRTVCSYIDTKEGKQDCHQYPAEKRAKMTQKWAN